MNIYYVYQYLREDLTPYYIGKGKDKRAWEPHKRSNGTDLLPNDNSKIQVVAKTLSENEAHLLETKLIEQYGRKDLGTGILRNLTDGGEGASGRKRSIDSIKKQINTARNNGSYERTSESIIKGLTTKMDRYGTLNPTTPESINKLRKTKLDRYGTLHHSTPESIVKSIETKKKNGTLNVNTSESIAKAKETKKKNGTTGHGRKLPLESYKKGWETRRTKKESIQ